MASIKFEKPQIIVSDDESFEVLQIYADQFEIIRSEKEMSPREKAAIVWNLLQDSHDLWGTEEQYEELWGTKEKKENRYKLLEQWAIDMDEAIKQHLDHESIGEFISQILLLNETAAQTAKAYARHAENRALKETVFTWLDSNMKDFKSMEKAASAIAGKIVPIEFRTARKWVGEWKKLRSAGTL